MRKLYFLILFAIMAFSTQAQRAPVALNDVATVAENGTLTLNVLANDSNFNQPDSVCITALYGGPSAWASVAGCGKVAFHPLNPTFVGLDTFYYISCDQVLSNLCDTGRVIVTVYIVAPKAVNDTITLPEGDSITLNVLANDTNYNPNDSLRITNVFGSVGWVSILDSSSIQVHPTEPSYFGLITFNYRACDMRSLLCDTGLVAVNIIRAPIAYSDSAAQIQPDTSFFNVIVNDSDLNVLDSACLTNIWGLPAGWASIQGCDQIAYDPADFNFAGLDTFYYRSCYTRSPALCDTGMVIVTVTLPVPQVDFEWDDNIPCEAQLFNNSVITDSVVWTIQYLIGNDTLETINNLEQFTLPANSPDSGLVATVCLTGFNPSGDSTVCYTLYIGCDLNSGIKLIESSPFLLYPNPASDWIQVDMSKVNISGMDAMLSMQISDMAGRELTTISSSEFKNAIPIGDLNIGMYIMTGRAASGENKVLGKFEVMR